MHCRHNEKIETHIWMLYRLLEGLRSTDDLFVFLLYVIAACYPKMQLRMKNLAVSVPNRTALKEMPVYALQFSEQSHPYKDDERANDFLFLSEILKIGDFENKMPNLIREAKNAKTLRYSYHLDFYTNDTWIEFHLILCNLLEQFWDSLEGLNNLRSTDINEIIRSLVAISNIGSALRAMVRGGAIKKHLKLIANFFPDRPTVTKCVDEREDEEDEELCAVQPFALHQGQPLPKWKAYSNWLALMVTHFDAVQVLATFVLKTPVPLVNLTLEDLSPSQPDRTMLSWKRLLLHHLPASSDSPSTEDIIDFLSPKLDETSKGKKKKHPRKAVSSTEMEQIVELVQDIRRFSGRKDDKDNFTKAVDKLIQNLKRPDCVALGGSWTLKPLLQCSSP